MTHTQQRIEEIRKNGYKLNFSDVFNHTIENYKKIVFTVPVILILYLVLCLYGFDFMVLIFGIQNFRNLLENIESSGQFLLIYMLIDVLLALFIAPFIAGFLKMVDCTDKNEKFSEFTIFYYFRLPYLANIIGAALLISIVEVSVSVWLETLNLPFLGTVISLLITLFTCLTIPLIIFGKLNAVKAIKTSLMVTSKKPLILTLTGIMVVVIGFLGLEKMLGFLIPFQQMIVIFTLPFIYSMIYTIYSLIIGSEIEKPDSNPEISS